MTEHKCIECKEMKNCYSCEFCLNRICNNCVKRFTFNENENEIVTSANAVVTDSCYVFCNICFGKASNGEIEKNDILTYLVKCDDCGRVWDGNAQCQCEKVYFNNSETDCEEEEENDDYTVSD